MNIAVYTLGCKLNQSESEALASAFRSRGFFVVAPTEEASLYILNSCTVTSMAEQKARRMIRKFSSEGGGVGSRVVVVTGCYAQLDSQEIEKLGKNVIVTGMDGKSRLLDLPEFLFAQQFSGDSLFQMVKEFLLLAKNPQSIDRFRFNATHYSYHSRAFIKIQDGCDNRCTYCRIPLARGGSQSLSYKDSLDRVDVLLEGGYKEIVLTGINISVWSDVVDGKEKSLADLIRAIAHRAVQFGARVRLSSLEPDRLTEDLLDGVTAPGVVAHLHIPLQSMSQSVLTRMNRHYTIEDVITWIEEYRTRVTDPFLAADLITGFDGESDEEFRETLEVMKKLDFAHLHVFPFSPREGTLSYKPKNPVPERIRDLRAVELRELSTQQLKEYWNRNEGRRCSFLVEGIIEEEDRVFVHGVTDNYLQAKMEFSVESFKQVAIENRMVLPAIIGKENLVMLSSIETLTVPLNLTVVQKKIL